jgi:hypothetical protein
MLSLAQYADAFASNDVDLEVLPSLSEADLEKLGVSLGHRKSRDKGSSNPLRFSITQSDLKVPVR